MMMIVRKRRLVAFVLLIGLLFLGSGLYGFRSVANAAAGGAQETRAVAEELLFLSLVCILTFGLVAVAMFKRASSLDRKLDRLLEKGQNHDIVPGRDFSDLGPLGDKLTELFNLLSQLNYQKSRKIGAMQSLIVFLIRNQTVPMAICDASGIVRYVSDSFLEKLERSRVEVLDQELSDSLPDLPLDLSIQQLSWSRDPLEGRTEFAPYIAYPFTDRSGELAYLVFLFGAKAGFYEKRIEEPQEKTRRRNALASGLDLWKSLMNRRNRR